MTSSGRFMVVASLLLLSLLLRPHDASARKAASATGKGTRVTSFAQLQAVLEAGKSVRLINRYKRCTEKDPRTGETRAGADAIGGMIVDAWEYFGPGVNGNEAPYLIGSRDWLALIRGTFYREYAKIRFHADGRVEVIIKWIDEKTGQVTDVHDLVCRIDDGRGVEAVTILVAD